MQAAKDIDQQERFKTVKCSAVALMKMVMHAKASLAPRPEDDLEAGGYLVGHIEDDVIYVMDAVPVLLDSCSNVHCEFGDKAGLFIGAHEEFTGACGAIAGRVGWFHSHPGFGVWLSGTDVQTQRKFQNFMGIPHAVGIVVDPKRSMSAGQVEIGAFRTYYDDEIADKMRAKKKD
jgi:COP9 signalosome complex subunit 5